MKMSKNHRKKNVEKLEKNYQKYQKRYVEKLEKKYLKIMKNGTYEKSSKMSKN